MRVLTTTKHILLATAFGFALAANAGPVRAWWHFNGESPMADENGKYAFAVDKPGVGAVTLTPQPVEGVRQTPFLADADGKVTWLDANVADALPIFDGGAGCEIYITAGTRWQELNELFPVNDDNTVKSFTIELIAKVDESSEGNLSVITLGGGRSHLIAVFESGNQCYVSCGNDASSAVWQKSTAGNRRAIPRDGKWHHLALAYDEAGGANGEGSKWGQSLFAGEIS